MAPIFAFELQSQVPGRCFGTLDKGAGEDRRAGKGVGGMLRTRKTETPRAEGQKGENIFGPRQLEGPQSF